MAGRPFGQPTVDVSQFVRAEFSGADYATFDHFSNPDQPGCFACNSREMLVKPIEVTDGYTLMVATTRLPDRTFVVIPGAWLVYPRRHLISLAQMPYNWTASVQCAVATLGIQGAFCTSDNWGPQAGQTIAHAHTWIVMRGLGEEGLLTENIGLATMLLHARQYGIPKPS